MCAVSKINSLAQGHPRPCQVYPAGQLQWQLTGGLDFVHCLQLLFVAAFGVLKQFVLVSLGTMGPIQAGNNYFQGLKGFIIVPVGFLVPLQAWVINTSCGHYWSLSIKG